MGLVFTCTERRGEADRNKTKVFGYAAGYQTPSFLLWNILLFPSGFLSSPSRTAARIQLKNFVNSVLKSRSRSSEVNQSIMAGRSGIHSASIFFLLLLLLFLCCSITFSQSTRLSSLQKLVDGENKDEYNCVYTIYVRTGTIWKGGTDSIISLAIAGADGDGVLIEDLESWGGLMGDGHDYYERGNLDIFSGRGPCISSWPPCWMNLTSDGSGPGHGWYCNYVEVTTTGPHMGCNQQLFTVEQWLARDASPYKLYAIRDLCPNSGDGEAEGGEEIATIGKAQKRHVIGA